MTPTRMQAGGSTSDTHSALPQTCCMPMPWKANWKAPTPPTPSA